MKPLQFYDFKGKKRFITSTYRTTTSKGRRVAVAKAPSGMTVQRYI